MDSLNLYGKSEPLTAKNTHFVKPSIAIGHPRLGWGGSEKRVWWGIQALKEDYDIAIITAGEFDLEEVNRYYGTSLKVSDFTVRQAPLPFFLRRNEKAAALRGALYQRFCRRIAHEYDVLISAYGPCDFGIPAIHFIADFSWDNEIRKKLHPPSPGFIYRENLLRKSYLLLSKALCNYSGRDLFSGEDIMIAVSPWVAKIMKDKYKVDCEVIYSPVPGDFSSAKGQKKEFGFVSLGRIYPEKRIERTIEILSKVRQKGHDIHFHIIGGIDKSPYCSMIRELHSKNAGWIILENRLYGKEKIELLGRHLFGIQGCQGDAFPGAVIEMMKAGCIVFVPNEGGQVDIVNHSALIYDSVEDAADKIDIVLKNVQLQNDLLKHLSKQANIYSIENFMTEIRTVVREFLEKKQKSFISDRNAKR